MVINLKKGQQISIAKEAPGLTRILCGLGWDVAERSPGFLSIFSQTSDFDLDASVICVDENNKLRQKSDVIYFGNLRHPSGSITHLGDNLTGEGDGDDEQIIVDLSTIPNEIQQLIFTVNIYKCIERQQDFGQVKNAFVRLVNLSNNKVIAHYNLSGSEYTGMTAMIMAEVYRHENHWKMAATGTGLKVKGISELLRSYA